MFSMMNELKDLLKKGEEDKVITKYAVTVGDTLWNALYSYIDTNYKGHTIESVCEEENQLFSVLRDEGEKYYRLNFSASENNEYNFSSEIIELENYIPETEPQFSLEDIEKYIKEKNEDKTGKDNTFKNNNISEEKKCPNCGKALSECTCEKKDEENKKKYNLEEIPEYIELRNTYSALETSFNELKIQKEELEEKIKPLIEFKKEIEKKEKEDMIASFYMLSDELKKDVIENIDSYSLEDIESKLSIICVRNKVAFDVPNNEQPTTYNLANMQDDDSLTPAWVKAIENTIKIK
jgi:DNA repair exonuclease SbcCD ATPase subunit